MSSLGKGSTPFPIRQASWPSLDAKWAPEREGRQAGERVAERHRQEAARLLQAARSEAENLRQAAYREGYAYGRRVAEEEFTAERDRWQEEAQQQQAAALRSIETALAGAEERVEASKAEIIELGVALAGELLQKELAAEPECLLSLVETLLREMRDCTRVTLRVHPLDTGFLEARREELAGRLATNSQLQVVTDERITRGGLVLESEAGGIDARLESRLERILTTLKEVFHGQY